MKKINYTIAFIAMLFNYTYSQQNLVPNPSFENYTACPTTAGDFNIFDWWVSSQTPDYFNVCANTNTNGCSGVPENACGYQQPSQGNAYCGVYTLDYNVSANYREYISAKLTNTLTIGTKYYFSMQVVRGQDTNFTTHPCAQGNNGATNKIGALFSTKQYNTLNPINFAHIFESNIVTDTVNWTQIKGSFIADSAYQYINLGNFFDDNHTDTFYVYHLPSWTNPTACIAFYYIDNVILSTDSSLVNHLAYNSLQNNFKLYPNPFSDFFYIDNLKDIQTISIYNSLGYKIKFLFTKENESVTKVQLDDSLENGIYFLTIQTHNKIVHCSLIKN